MKKDRALHCPVKIQIADAYRTLLSIPGILGVSVGCKEVGSKVTDHIAIRVYVAQKKPLSALRPEDIVPSVLYGIRTDVIAKFTSTPAYGDSYEETLSPGLKIESQASSDGALGCFVKPRNDGSKVYLLSARHVLFADTNATGLDVGQPSISCSWCCACRVIGTNVGDGHDGFNSQAVTVQDSSGTNTYQGSEIDCAVAVWNGKRAYTNNIPGIGMISGTPPAGSLGVAANDIVEKVGPTTGHTTGKILGFTFNAHYADNTPVPNILYPFVVKGTFVDEDMAGAVQNINQLLIAPLPDPQAPNRKMYFVNHGDSGSVVVNSAKQVVGLICRAWFPDDATRQKFGLPAHVGSLGIANPIQKVLDALNIEIPANLSGTVGAAGTMIKPESPAQPIGDEMELEKRLEAQRRRLQGSEAGREFLETVQRHRKEVMRMVNRVRPVTVTWHRNQGPAFVGHALKSVRETGYRIPSSVNGTTRSILIERMAAVLHRYGSPPLRKDIERFYRIVRRHIQTCDSVDELVRRISDWQLSEVDTMTEEGCREWASL